MNDFVLSGLALAVFGILNWLRAPEYLTGQDWQSLRQSDDRRRILIVTVVRGISTAMVAVGLILLVVGLLRG